MLRNPSILYTTVKLTTRLYLTFLLGFPVSLLIKAVTILHCGQWAEVTALTLHRARGEHCHINVYIFTVRVKKLFLAKEKNIFHLFTPDFN